MTDHLNPEHIAAYRTRSLAPGDLVAADFHLAICDACRQAVAGSDPDAALLRGLASAKVRHLSYEQMEGYAEGTLDPTLQEFVLAHVALCGRCAKELRDFAEFVPVMDAPIDPKPARKEAATWWTRWTAAITRTQWAVAASAAAAVVLAILIPANIGKNATQPTQVASGPGSRNPQGFAPPQVDAIAEAQLAELPPDVRADVSRIVEAQEGVRPASLSRLTLPGTSRLLDPLGIVVPEQSPVLRWSGVLGASTVHVFSRTGAKVIDSGEVAGNEWRVPVTLARGESYHWTLEAGGAIIGQGVFEVLSDAGFREWADAQSRYAGSHLLLGAMAQHLGMLDEAQNKYAALQLEKPTSAIAARMLRNLQAIRGLASSK